MSLSGFMVVRNGFAGGYPFLEAIQSALPICDEFHVGDGASGDGTWEALQALSDAHEKVRIVRTAWPLGVDRRHVIAKVTNQLLAHCRSRYCFNLQANEIVHERAVAQLGQQPGIDPSAELFRLPFLTVMGSDIGWRSDFRRRLFLNHPGIVSRGDGYDCGYDPLRLLLRSPRRFGQYLLHRKGERTVHLAAPVFRYRALFPVNYLTKLRARVEPSPAWREELERAERAWDQCDPEHDPPEAFWQQIRPHFQALGRIDDAPAIIRPLFGRWRHASDLNTGDRESSPLA